MWVEAGRAIVQVDVGDVDPSSTAVDRLVDSVVAQALAATPGVEAVEVRSRAGRVLAVRLQEAPRVVSVAPDLYDPHAPRHAGPDVRSSLTAASAGRPGVADAGEAGDLPRKALADRLDLPASVRGRISDPDDVVGLVTAILDAAGIDHRTDGSVVRAGDAAVIVVPAAVEEPVSRDELSEAFLRFQHSGARRGVVITPGHLQFADVRRRQAMAPDLLHAGFDGLQRMADAVELGADPIGFAANPATASRSSVG
jgi:hypothetical protein